jgi:hypothetical protein
VTAHPARAVGRGGACRAIIDALFRLREHPGMTASELPGAQPPEDDTALLTAALNHYWAAHDGRFNRAFQTINYYLVATAILFTGYTSGINGKHYGEAALAIAALGITALTATGVLGNLDAAALTEPGLGELQHRMAGILRIDPIRTAAFPTRTQRRIGAVFVFGLAALTQISGLLYALIH